MSAEEHLTEGERAKRHLRVAQTLAILAKTRNPSISRVKDATARLQSRQPAVAMAILAEYAKRQPLHERGEWLQAASQALREYRLGEGADQKEAELAHEHIERETALHKAELARIEKLRERFSIALLFVLVIAMLAGLVYVGYSVLKERKPDTKEPAQSTVEKSSDKKTAPKTATAKTPPASTNAETKPAEAKKTEKDSQTAQPAKK